MRDHWRRRMPTLILDKETIAATYRVNCTGSAERN
jgi:hypothetical protein